MNNTSAATIPAPASVPPLARALAAEPARRREALRLRAEAVGALALLAQPLAILALVGRLTMLRRSIARWERERYDARYLDLGCEAEERRCDAALAPLRAELRAAERAELEAELAQAEAELREHVREGFDEAARCAQERVSAARRELAVEHGVRFDGWELRDGHLVMVPRAPAPSAHVVRARARKVRRVLDELQLLQIGRGEPLSREQLIEGLEKMGAAWWRSLAERAGVRELSAESRALVLEAVRGGAATVPARAS